jgi:hypothetical protein
VRFEGARAAPCAPAVRRSITSSADSSGNRLRTNAATPDTYAAAKLELFSPNSCPWSLGSALARPPPSALPTDAMFSPGAAIPTHGPAVVKPDGRPLDVSELTDNTYGCHTDGIDIDVTPDQFRGSSGRPGSDSGFDGHAEPGFRPARLLPAEATTTASFSTAA